MSVCWLVHHFGPDWNISTTIRWYAMKFCGDIYCPQSTNTTNIGDPLSLTQDWPAGQSFHLSSEISQHLLDGLTPNVVRMFMGRRWWTLMTLEIPRIFLLSHHGVHICGFEWNVSTNIGWIAIKSDTDIPLRMNYNDFGDPLTSYLVPSLGQNFNVFSTLVYDQILY